jgi:hypothetical protein
MATLPVFIKPKVIIVTDKITPTYQREEEARKEFLWLVKEETTANIFDVISTIDVVVIPTSRAIGASI